MKYLAENMQNSNKYEGKSESKVLYFIAIK